jgi:site-specific recombinase XerD
MKDISKSSTFPRLLQDFFCQGLIKQLSASPQTIASYRDTFRLLLSFAQDFLGKAPSSLVLGDLDAPLVLAFLDHLECRRSNTVRTRNARLAAIRSFMKYVGLHDPIALLTVQRVLAIPFKRFDRPLIGYLSRDEMEAILSAPRLDTWSGQRDKMMLETFYNTGARVSEIISLSVGDLALDRKGLTIHGKGRKERIVPLWNRTSAHLKQWLCQIPLDPFAPLFPNRAGQRISRSGVEARLEMAVATAAERQPSLRDRHISPHVLRHTTAMHLLQSGVDFAVIALWLGHESPSTTHLYVEADLAMKERALKKLQPPVSRSFRFRPSDDLLHFLNGL